MGLRGCVSRTFSFSWVHLHKCWRLCSEHCCVYRSTDTSAFYAVFVIWYCFCQSFRTLLVALRSWLIVFLEPFSSPRCTCTLAGGYALTRVVHINPQTWQLLMLSFVPLCSDCEKSRMLLVALKNWVITFLKSFPSPSCTKTFAGECALSRAVHIFPHTHSSCFLHLKTAFVRPSKCWFSHYGTECLSF